MVKLKINAVSIPKYCSGCHQSDCFDPINNHCSRCNNVFSLRDRSRRNNIRTLLPTLWQPINYTKENARTDAIIAILITAVLFGGLGITSSLLFKFSLSYFNSQTGVPSFQYMTLGFILGSTIGAIYGICHEVKSRKAWQASLQQLSDQEKPALKIVDGSNILHYRAKK